MNDKFDIFMANQNEGQDTLIQNQKFLLEAMSQIKSKIENPLNHDHIAELQRELEDTKKQVEDTQKQVEDTKKQVQAERKQVEATKLRLEEEKMSRRKSRQKRTAQTNENISTNDFTNTSHFEIEPGNINYYKAHLLPIPSIIFLIYSCTGLSK